MKHYFTFGEVYEAVYFEQDEIKRANYITILIGWLTEQLHKIFETEDVERYQYTALLEQIYNEVNERVFLISESEDIFDAINNILNLETDFDGVKAVKTNLFGIERYKEFGAMETHFQSHKDDILSYFFDNGKTTTEVENYFNPINVAVEPRLNAKQKVTANGDESRHKDLKAIYKDAKDFMSPLQYFVEKIFAYIITYGACYDY